MNAAEISTSSPTEKYTVAIPNIDFTTRKSIAERGAARYESTTALLIPRVSHSAIIISAVGNLFLRNSAGISVVATTTAFTENSTGCLNRYVIPAASEAGGVVTNGYSLCARDGENANAAVLVGISPDDFGHDPFDGVHLQREIEEAAFRAGGGNYKAPCQRAEDFLAHRRTSAFGSVSPTYARGVTPGDIRDCLPPMISDALCEALPIFARQLSPFAMGDALLTAPETRSSSPLRILRGEDGQSNLRGLYPAGEGSGYAGGIMSAAIDGIRAALSILSI